ncbi:MAG: helix-turn-helix domain-containing protein [Chlamydiae bacterium]|nr:helix-turn-helix domain-containing protein [Chlamydiota bacterium]
MEDYIKSSGNVFVDLELPNAEERLAKAELARQIEHIIKRKRLTQERAAKILGISQPKVSALLSGKLAGFNMDRLLKILMDLDQDIEIKIKAKPARIRRRARTTILS